MIVGEKYQKTCSKMSYIGYDRVFVFVFSSVLFVGYLSCQ